VPDRWQRLQCLLEPGDLSRPPLSGSITQDCHTHTTQMNGQCTLIAAGIPALDRLWFVQKAWRFTASQRVPGVTATGQPSVFVPLEGDTCQRKVRYILEPFQFQRNQRLWCDRTHFFSPWCDSGIRVQGLSCGAKNRSNVAVKWLIPMPSMAVKLDGKLPFLTVMKCMQPVHGSATG
jgi:hypothetical protein